MTHRHIISTLWLVLSLAACGGTAGLETNEEGNSAAALSAAARRAAAEAEQPEVETPSPRAHSDAPVAAAAPVAPTPIPAPVREDNPPINLPADAGAPVADAAPAVEVEPSEPELPPVPGLGEACPKVGPLCKPGGYCSTLLVCLPLLENGDTCTADFACLTGYCEPMRFRGAGAPTLGQCTDIPQPPADHACKWCNGMCLLSHERPLECP